uniref:Hyla-br1 n=1 Tax=Pombalia lanata TaxID=1895898 RepID=A0A1B3TNB3_9ROSI|nr:hyla-br1 precursor [Pombalia lanata]
MDAKKMLVGLFLIAALALPALATFEKDVITAETMQAVLEKTGGGNAINLLLNSKTIISKTVLEEALIKTDHSANGVIPCGESCVFIPCISSFLGCSCKNKVCYRNSLVI